MSEYAIRHPKRGKAHRSTLTEYAPLGYAGDTVCGKWARDMTERIRVDLAAPEDLCARCFPQPPDVVVASHLIEEKENVG